MPPNSRPARGDRSGVDEGHGLSIADVVWMPPPREMPQDRLLTRQEATTVRRLRKPRRRAPDEVVQRLRERMAARRRRRLLARLGYDDLRSLAQLVIRLGL
jgi:hypothetical protein